MIEPLTVAAFAIGINHRKDTTTMTEAQRTFDAINRQAQSRHGHARSCTKAPDVCKTCIDNRRYFDSLPLDTLARVLADSPKTTHAA